METHAQRPFATIIGKISKEFHLVLSIRRENLLGEAVSIVNNYPTKILRPYCSGYVTISKRSMLGPTDDATQCEWKRKKKEDDNENERKKKHLLNKSVKFIHGFLWSIPTLWQGCKCFSINATFFYADGVCFSFMKFYENYTPRPTQLQARKRY